MMSGMVSRQGGALAQIQADVVSGVPLSQLLSKIVVLGREAGSQELLDWANQELHGYVGADSVPVYRHVAAVVMLALADGAGRSAGRQRFSDSLLPEQFREIIRGKFDMADAYLSQGVGEVEAMAAAGTAEHDLIPYWSPPIAKALDDHYGKRGVRITDVFWTVSNVSVQGVLVRIRATLAQLVAEMAALTLDDQEAPDKAAADKAFHIVVTGDRPTINYSAQQAGDGGTNVAVAGAAATGPVTVAGAHGSATGSQTATGANATVTGSQAVNGAGSAVAGGLTV